jgi:hypothetical protein
MLVVLPLLLLQAKAHIVMAETRNPVSPAKRRLRYIIAAGLWAAITGIVMVFAVMAAGR